MTILLTIFVFILAMGIHEFGHAWEMKKQGVEIAEIGIGIPIPKLPYLRLSVRHLWGINIVLTFHPLLLGAYVKPSEVGYQVAQSLPDRALHLIYAGGIVANLLTWGIITIVFGLLGWMNMTLMIPAVIATILCLFLRTVLSVYIIPILGLVFTGLVVHSLVAMPVTESVAGPAGVVSLIHGQIAGKSSLLPQLKAAVFMLGFISLVLGTMNTLPLYVLDGGRSVLLYLQKWGFSRKALEWYMFGSTGIFVCLVILAFYSDAVKLIFN